MGLHSSVGTAINRYRRGHEFESRCNPENFWGVNLQLLKIAMTAAKITLLLRVCFFCFHLDSQPPSSLLSYAREKCSWFKTRQSGLTTCWLRLGPVLGK